MTELGRILIADDEETFLYSTADLLRREGYECDCALDAATAAGLLRGDNYDLLIADIKMPGNAELEFISELPDIAEGMPVILVTGYPSLNSAIQSIQLPVVDYLVKPIDFDKLLAQVRMSTENSRLYRAVRSTQQRLQDWHNNLTSIEKILQDPTQRASDVSVDTFLELTFQNTVGAMSDMKHLAESFATQNVNQEVRQEACHLLNCPRLAELTGALVNTINVLEATKSAFKSKALGELRKTLEKTVRKVNGENLPPKS